MKQTNIVSIGIIIAFFIISFYIYPAMPSQIASHWGIDGQVDGYMPKFWGLFMMPTIAVLIFILFLFFPAIDPLKENYAKFQRYYEGFKIVLLAFLFYIYTLSIAWNLGYKFEMIRLLLPAFAAMFYYLGILLKNSKTNWFIGIRTPWTLSSEKIWDKTHALGAKLFKITAVSMLVGAILPNIAIYLFFIPLFVSIIYLVIYSYILFRREKNAVKN